MRKWIPIFAILMLYNGCAYIPLSVFPTDPQKMEEVRIAEERKRMAPYESKLVGENYKK